MILVRLMGGLGNQMFQYACGKALAHRHTTELKIDLSLLLLRVPDPHVVIRDYELATMFQLDVPLATHKEIQYYNPTPNGLLPRVVNRIRRWGRPPRTYIEQGDSFDSEVLRLPDNHCLVGRFQSEKYFAHIENKIREDFSFRNMLNEEEQVIAHQILNTESICVHVRRGDYVSNTLYSEMLGFIGNAYYHQAMDKITESVAAPKVFVFSDEIDWCRENLLFQVDTIYIRYENRGIRPQADLQLMALCKHFIVPNSTFSWWAAWLGTSPEKIVIAPKRWSKNGEIESADRIPERWIQI